VYACDGVLVLVVVVVDQAELNRLGGESGLGLLVMHLCLDPGFLLLLLGLCVWARLLSLALSGYGPLPLPPITKTGSPSGAGTRRLSVDRDLIRPALLALRAGVIRGTHTPEHENAHPRIGQRTEGWARNGCDETKPQGWASRRPDDDSYAKLVVVRGPTVSPVVLFMEPCRVLVHIIRGLGLWPTTLPAPCCTVHIDGLG
jgi:hypothetical protein